MNTMSIHGADRKIMRRLVKGGFKFHQLPNREDGWIDLMTDNLCITFCGKLEEETEDDVKDCKEV